MILVSIVLLQSCFTKEKLVKEKCDVALLNTIQKANETEIIKLSIISQSKITDQQKQLVKDAGIEINSVVGKIATVSADKEKISKLSNLDFVVRLESSKKMKPIRKMK